MATAASTSVSKAWTSLWRLIVSSRQGITDTVLSMVPQGLTLISGLVASILLARGLGPEGMGHYALILSFSGLVMGLTDLGITQTAVRFASRAVALGDSELHLTVLRWAFRLRMVAVLVVGVAAYALAPVITGNIWHAPQLSSLVRLSLLTCVFTGVSSVPMTYFQSLRRFKANAAVSTTQAVLVFIGILAVAGLRAWSVYWVVTVSVAAAAIVAVVFVALIPGRAYFDPAGTPRSPGVLFGNILRFPHSEALATRQLDGTGVNEFAGYMVLAALLSAVILRADVWLMGAFLNKPQVGLYCVASYISMPVAFVVLALNTALWPRFSALTDRRQTASLLRGLLLVCAVLALCLLAYSIAAPLLIPSLFGELYRPGIGIGQLLCVRYCISVICVPLALAGYSFGIARVVWRILLVQATAVFGLNMLLLTAIGPAAAAIALIANDLVWCALTYAFLRRRGVWRTDLNAGAASESR